MTSVKGTSAPQRRQHSAEQGQAVAAPRKHKHLHIRQFREDEMSCFRVLTDYLHLLEDWKVQYAPKTPADDLDDRFGEACQMLDRIEYLTDILTVGDYEMVGVFTVPAQITRNSKLGYGQIWASRLSLCSREQANNFHVKTPKLLSEI